MATDLYAILGVSPSATGQEITHAFRLLVRQHHPDTRSSDGSAGRHDAALQDAVDAYRVLNDPVRRSAYDDEHQPPAPRVPPAPRLPGLGTPGTTPQPWIREGTRPSIIAGPVYWQPARAR